MTDQSRSAGNPNTGTTWMFRTKEGVVGPIDTEQLLLAVRQGVVVSQTLVRLTDRQEWIAAGEIDGLEFPATSRAAPHSDPAESVSNAPHPPSNSEMRRLFAECIDRQRSHAPRPPRARAKSQASRLNVQLGSAFGSVISSVSETVRSIFECVFSLLTRVFISRVVWGGILVLLVVLVLPQLVSKIPASFGTQQQGYLSLLETFTELKELRSKRVDEGTWREFQERSEDKLAKMLPNLERNAKSSDPVSMSLLRIARDYLPRLLNDQERLSTEAERTIEAHLMVVKNGTQVARSSGASWDVLATLMVGLDILGACVAFGYFGYIVLKRVLPGAKHR